MIDEHSWMVGDVRLRCRSLLGRPIWGKDTHVDDLGRLSPILITGGAGGLGNAIVEKLQASSAAEIVVADKDPSRLHATRYRFPKVDTLLLDVADQRRTFETFRQIRPMAVIHLAACKYIEYCEADPVLAFRDNTISAINVAREALAIGSRVIVLASTDKVAAGDSILRETKLPVEAITRFRTTRTRITAIRLPNIMGTTGNVLDVFAGFAQAGQALPVWSSDMSRWFICVHEAADIFILTLAGLDSSEAIEVLIPEFARSMPIAELASRFAAEWRVQRGLTVQVAIHEEFDAVHNRHETLEASDDYARRPVASGLIAVRRPCIFSTLEDLEFSITERVASLLTVEPRHG